MVKPSYPRASKANAPPSSSSKNTASTSGASKQKASPPAAQADQDVEMPAPRDKRANERPQDDALQQSPNNAKLPALPRAKAAGTLRAALFAQDAASDSSDPDEEDAPLNDRRASLQARRDATNDPQTPQESDAQATCTRTAPSTDRQAQAQTPAQARAQSSTSHTAQRTARHIRNENTQA